MSLIISDDGPRKRRKRTREMGGPSRPPRGPENDFYRALTRLNALLRQQTRLLSRMVNEGASLEAAQARIESELVRANAAYNAAARQLPADPLNNISKTSKRRLESSIKQTLGVKTALILDSPVVAETLKAAITESTALIRTIPRFHFGQVEKAILANYRGEEFAEGSLSARLRKIYRVTDTRSRIIARDQTAKLFGNLNEMRQMEVGIDRYVWQTAGDERVTGYPGGPNKPTSAHGNHYERNGVTFKWAEPPSDGHPGSAIMCRCVAMPIADIEQMIERAEVISARDLT